MTIRDSIIRLVGRHDLSESEAASAMSEIMGGEATPAQIAAFLTALHLKGETAAELAGMARIMRDFALMVEAAPGAVDTCGTGGGPSTRPRATCSATAFWPWRSITCTGRSKAWRSASTGAS